ncbi:MAG: hypothetical protein H0X44_06295, partial [Acidobacteria bacterium]|nr:hypothetical protein [Acidobacteriota bacterium]
MHRDSTPNNIMSNKHLFIAAAAVAITGTAGMASWLALDSGEVRARQSIAQPVTPAAGAASTGVAETEAAVLPPPTPLALGPTERVEPEERSVPVRAARVAHPKTVEAPEWQPPAAAQRAPQPSAEPTEPAEPAERAKRAVPEFMELTIPANAIIGVRLSTSVSSETAEIEDRVEASVTRDVIAAGHVAVPAGTRLLGSVNDVTRGGTFREKARLAVRFHTLVLADGTRAPVRVDAIVREGESPVRESATKVGVGAAGGAIIGGIMGGRKGALLGG